MAFSQILKRWNYSLSFLGLLLWNFNLPLNAQTVNACPGELEPLIDRLLKDLPSYTNRVIQRSRRRDRIIDRFSYVIVAGKPEFVPLPLQREQEPPDSPHQVFFTTLERQYRGDGLFGSREDNRILETQHYHWLFLTETSRGWRKVMLFSRLGSPAENRPPLPPRETSNGSVGQAIQLWLRDCRADSLR